MNNYNQHYKEISPIETVNNIKNFLEGRGFTCVEEALRQEQSTTWSLVLNLEYKGHFVLKTYGKGVTKEFARASGYAEMYERFCNKMSFWTSIPFFDKLCEYNLKNNGYYLFPNERIMTLNEMVKNSRIC